MLFLAQIPPKENDSDETLVFATLPSRMTTNKILRQWVEKADIDKKITYHMPRHITFSYSLKTRNLQRLSA